MSESDRAGQRAKVITAGEGDASQTRADAPLDPRLQALVDGHDGDPFALLGPRATGGGMRIVAMAQGAEAMAVLNAQGKVVALMRCVHPAGLFEAELPTQMAYRLRNAWP